MKKTLILFSSRGQSAKIVAYYVANYLAITNDLVFNVSKDLIKLEDVNFEHVILISPTYGDEELEESMEACMINSKWSIHSGKTFSVIELGLYRGYEFPLLGAARIIKMCLENYGLKITSPILSLDSVPYLTTELLQKWLANNF